MSRISKNVLQDAPVHQYEGHKHPEMASQAAILSPLPLGIIASQIDRARQYDFKFLADINYIPNTSEFGGYNTGRAREKDHPIRHTNAVYLLLIDMAPAESPNMLTAMVETQQLTSATGQTLYHLH